MVINTPYKELMKFVFANLRYERELPFRDGFLLVKNLSHKENQLLKRFNNYVVVSDSYFTETWGREEIYEYCRGLIKSRRKPTYSNMHDDEFVKNIKIFLVSGTWVSEDIEAGTFELFKKLDWKPNRFTEYFNLREKGVNPNVILYSLLTFASKAMHPEKAMGVSTAYLKLLHSKRPVVTANLKRSILRYANMDKKLDDDFKLARFLMDLGGGYK